ncbi:MULTISPECIES: hypothetical protein [Bacillus]|uniref:DsrE family protein n=2 Tax=Bacillus TaxID=1386 RepID=A0A0M4FS76_9BACI|nr:MULTISPECIES: hypothetical protein [Bacillus]ALC82560.1 hypothetical protein AM592_13970 [Bacillus gobiensis]MBP1081480.1 putative peroxiredoxin [Bacillus capparidis]MED1096147.1 hypothetical protein [Bacillus capparidis]
MANKFVIIIQAGAQDAGKALHGLLYGQELHHAGYEVEIVFDGAGTTWVGEFEKTDHMFHPVFKDVMKLGIIKGGCQACSGFFDVKEEVKNGVGFAGPEAESGKHLDFAGYIKKGFQPIIL